MCWSRCPEEAQNGSCNTHAGIRGLAFSWGTPEISFASITCDFNFKWVERNRLIFLISFNKFSCYYSVDPKCRNDELVANLPVPSEKMIIRVESWSINKAVKVSLKIVKETAVGAKTCQLDGDSFIIQYGCCCYSRFSLAIYTILLSTSLILITIVSKVSCLNYE